MGVCRHGRGGRVGRARWERVSRRAARRAGCCRRMPACRACIRKRAQVEMQARRTWACGCACVRAGLPRSGGRQPRSCSARRSRSCPSCASWRPAAPRREAATAGPPDLSAAAPRPGGSGSSATCVARAGWEGGAQGAGVEARALGAAGGRSAGVLQFRGGAGRTWRGSTSGWPSTRGWCESPPGTPVP